MKKIKILVFEYITGGGLNKLTLPENLAVEGLLMLRALIDCLVKMPTVEFLVMLDYRVVVRISLANDKVFVINAEQDCEQEFTRLMTYCDAVWPIAPESDAVLAKLCALVEQSGKVLLNSSAATVALTGDKWLTYQHLAQYSIATVPTSRLTDFKYHSGEWLIKSADGVSCEDSYIIANANDFLKITNGLNREKYIIQPHLQGKKTSLSCLFKQGCGWLLSVNYQHFIITNQQYHLTEITVNYDTDRVRYHYLVNQIACAIPELWGYVGIDLIETAEQILVLEINPRLTTSFVGINAACGLNCAQAVLDLLQGEPALPIQIKQQSIHVNLSE